ncbi:hypothetical protein ACWGOK_31815 [Streptomyces eurythermus]
MSLSATGDPVLLQDDTQVSVGIDQEDTVWLAIVFRRLTPVDLDLVLCDEGYTFGVRLRAGTTEAELTDLVNAAG